MYTFLRENCEQRTHTTNFVVQGVTQQIILQIPCHQGHEASFGEFFAISILKVAH